MRNGDPKLFISYRRADSAAIVGHLYERLAAHFGRRALFRDIDDIPFGIDYRQHVTKELAGCDVVLAVIGPQWIGQESGGSRIMQDDDPVRIELETAFAGAALVIPVLVGGTSVPPREALPSSLEQLPSLNAARIDTGHDFDHHLASLLFGLDEALRQRGKIVRKVPQWARQAALVAFSAAAAPLLIYAASALFSIALQSWMVQACAAAFALLAGLGLALLATDFAAQGSFGLRIAAKLPGLAGALAYLVSVPLLYPLASQLASIMPLHDINHLSKALLAEFAVQRDSSKAGEKPDFALANSLVDSIRDIEPENGTAWYFAGEIARRRRADLFDAQSCFNGWPKGRDDSLDPFQQDFYRYIEIERAAGGGARNSDWGTQVCYTNLSGLCAQRTAWIYHLLANDGYHKALASSGAQRAANLREARDYVHQALRYVRPEGGNGFTQCIDSSALLAKIESMLAD